nr:MAG: DNA pilot protein [Microviridae sp.]
MPVNIESAIADGTASNGITGALSGIDEGQVTAPSATTTSTTSSGGIVSNIPVVGQVLTGLGNYISNSIFGGAANQAQLNQQGKLDQQQLQYNEQMANYNLQEQENLWNYTSYGNQVKNLEAAGLNPALIYGGGSGGGGSTAANTGNVSAPQAASAPQYEAATNQQALTAAQQAQIAAQTQNTEANTELTGIQGQSLTQGIINQKAIAALTNVQTEIATVTKEVQQGTVGAQMANITNQAQASMQEARSALVQANVDEQTVETKMGMIRTQYANAILQGQAIKQGIMLTQVQRTQIINSIQQGWEALQQNGMTARDQSNATQQQLINKVEQDAMQNGIGLGQDAAEALIGLGLKNNKQPQ